MKKIKSCGVLLVRGEPIEELLLMKHPDRYDLPKGHVDRGETELECALREMEEETGVTAADVELDPAFRFTTRYKVRSARYGGQEREKTLVIFLGRLLHDVPIVLTEHRGYEWIRWNPPHRIQEKTIDPLLAHLAEFLARHGK